MGQPAAVDVAAAAARADACWLRNFRTPQTGLDRDLAGLPVARESTSHRNGTSSVCARTQSFLRQRSRCRNGAGHAVVAARRTRYDARRGPPVPASRPGCDLLRGAVHGIAARAGEQLERSCPQLSRHDPARHRRRCANRPQDARVLSPARSATDPGTGQSESHRRASRRPSQQPSLPLSVHGLRSTALTCALTLPIWQGPVGSAHRQIGFL